MVARRKKRRARAKVRAGVRKRKSKGSMGKVVEYTVPKDGEEEK